MRVYVAGPYTKGDVEANVRAAIAAGDQLANAGHVPFIPHLTHYWDALHPHPWTFWMDQDFVWLRQCEALVRLPGASKGADMEVADAVKVGIPVFLSVEAFLEWCCGRK